MAATDELDDILNDALDELDEEDEEEAQARKHTGISCSASTEAAGAMSTAGASFQPSAFSAGAKSAGPIEATAAGTSSGQSTSSDAAGVGREGDEEETELRNTIAKTIDMLGKIGGGEGGKEAGEGKEMIDDAFLSKLVEEFDKLGAGFGDGGGGKEGGGEACDGGNEGGTDAMVDTMVRQLLAKDLMYPPLKEVVRQFPGWLEANKGKVEEEVYKKHEKQYFLFERIVAVYEKEGEGGKEGGDMALLLDLMTQAQDYGQPPAEIVQALGGGGMDGGIDPFGGMGGGMGGLLSAALAGGGGGGEGGEGEQCCVM
ncbi:peroxisomal biogenesis factor 19 [Nannochloropsis oceanica]